MALYLVRMDHPAGDGWDRHVKEHLAYLAGLVADGRLIASGPIRDIPGRAGFLIFAAPSRDAVQAMVDGDPFAREGLIETLRIEEWNPLFGSLSTYADGVVPSEVAALFPSTPDRPWAS